MFSNQNIFFRLVIFNKKSEFILWKSEFPSPEHPPAGLKIFSHLKIPTI